MTDITYEITFTCGDTRETLFLAGGEENVDLYAAHMGRLGELLGTFSPFGIEVRRIGDDRTCRARDACQRGPEAMADLLDDLGKRIAAERARHGI